MSKLLNPKFLFYLIAVTLYANTCISAQDTSVEVVPMAVTRAETKKNSDKEDEKGSVVRGRVTYRDSGAPVRRGWISFRKIKELVEPPKTETGGTFVSPYSSGADNYVLTNDQGEFEMKNVKAGIYQPILKVQGVLNPKYSDKENPLFQQIAVDGVSEIQTSIGVMRGAAVSGKISYADGSPVIGAKIQILDKSNRVIRIYGYSDDITTTTTDDLGYYRLSGLPAGDYFVRVIEPSLPVRTGETVRDYNLSTVAYSSELKTYYPSADNQKESTPVQLFLGQEQTDINISIPDRRLFTISGTVIAKTDKMPLKGIKITFSKVNEEPEYFQEYDGGQNRQLKTDEAGTWKFEDLPKGKYRVRATVTDEYVYENKKMVVKKPPVKYAPNAEIVDIKDDNAENIVIELSVGATVSGFISDENGSDLTNRFYISAISKDFKNNAGEGFGSTDKKEKHRLPFTISGISEGEYYLTCNTDDDFYVKSIKLGSKDLINEALKIEAGDKIENVEVVLSKKTGTVKGKVSNVKNDERALVVIIPYDEKGVPAFNLTRQTAANDKGEYSVKAAPGDYFIFVAIQKNRPNLAKFDEWLEEMKAKSERITVRLNETTEVNLNYPND